MKSLNTFNARQTFNTNNKSYVYFSLIEAEKNGLKGISRLPYSLKILLENLLRHEDNVTVTSEDIKALMQWLNDKVSNREISYRPTRVLMQDFTGVPAIVDLAAMRDAISSMGGNPDLINPLTPVDLVIDHSVQVDIYNQNNAAQLNADLEMQRNGERYQFLRWGQKAFENFRVVPPGTGICHQVNLEYLAKTVWDTTINDIHYAYPDTLVGTDSHTTMVNGLGVLGWGVGGIEAEAAMLGQPISMVIPEVIGVKLTGKLSEGVTATDLVLTLTHLLRKKGVVGKFVEYFGPGIQELSLADRATIANMAPEYGATCGFFPIDNATVEYLTLTGRPLETINLVETYAKLQGLWHEKNSHDPLFTDTIVLDLATVEPTIAGPKRPQDKVSLSELNKSFESLLSEISPSKKPESSTGLKNGDIVMAAITSCTNTSNPSVLMAAGLLAKKACEKNLKTKSWIKTSLAPGSQVVTKYLQESNLQQYLDKVGFSVVGYGCTTCIGNSGPLSDEVSEEIQKNNLVVSAVLSDNRNFEGRIHPQIKANWLASPPLVVAFALAGNTRINFQVDPLGYDSDNKPVYLKDIWPSNQEVATEVAKVSRSMFEEQYANVFEGSKSWQAINVPLTKTYEWQKNSSYIQNPPYFTDINNSSEDIQKIKDARILAILGDSITTDHISPAGSIKKDSPAGKYLMEQGILPEDFNSLGARRGNHEVMMRGTFANGRIKNEMVPDIEGGFTKYFPDGEILSIYDAAMRYKSQQIQLVIIAGKEYGTGSSRDWAAKGPQLLGVKAVIAESFERIHRSNLIGMGILPLEFQPGTNRKTLSLMGDEVIDIKGLDNYLKPRTLLTAVINGQNGKQLVPVVCRIDTINELEYYRHGGILKYVLRNLHGI